MSATSLLTTWATSAFGSVLLIGAVLAQPPSTASGASGGRMARVFAAGLEQLSLVFKGIGSLGGGATSGEIWRLDLRTGERRRIGNTADLAWPVPSPDGTAVYALRDSQVLRIPIAGGGETPIGAPADWRKLLGILPDGTVLGFVEGEPRPRPALMTPDGGHVDLVAPVDEAEQKRNGALLQEGRDYADGVRLEMRDSTRGGRGRDVFLIDHTGARNLTDCGDDFCGQPARSQDGVTIFYVRGPA
jgi:hypothetical protein